MKKKLLNILCCPDCRNTLALLAIKEANGEVEEGELQCETCKKIYPVLRFIPRFVPSENYADNFGFQWNQFRKTQLDSHTGKPIARDRFLTRYGDALLDFSGRMVLDVGCGAGRNSEVALSMGANLVAVDYSSAVDACWENLRSFPQLNVVQADIYHLPFKAASFDSVYCFGVLQHTPDVEKAFKALPAQLKAGAKLFVDVYPRLLLNIFWPKYWIRPFTKGIPPDRLFPIVQSMVKFLFPISIALGRIPYIGRKLRYAIPVLNYEGIFPLTMTQLKEWALLDTFDMLSPHHDHPQSETTLRRWFEEEGLKDIKVFRSGFIIGHGTKPESL
ncbi:MAG: methyltransferase domain-containing protein [Elusimicrobiota bacterium]|nr:methyltransferase domain-containing protein [Elusimicrobiota bacterium]